MKKGHISTTTPHIHVLRPALHYMSCVLRCTTCPASCVALRTVCDNKVSSTLEQCETWVITLWTSDTVTGLGWVYTENLQGLRWREIQQTYRIRRKFSSAFLFHIFLPWRRKRYLRPKHEYIQTVLRVEYEEKNNKRTEYGGNLPLIFCFTYFYPEEVSDICARHTSIYRFQGRKWREKK
jgi:hypothetical protein